MLLYFDIFFYLKFYQSNNYNWTIVVTVVVSKQISKKNFILICLKQIFPLVKIGFGQIQVVVACCY